MKTYLDLSETKGELWACSWNDGEILEIHTPETFEAKYKDSCMDLVDDEGVNQQENSIQYLKRYFRDRFEGYTYSYDNITVILIRGGDTE